MPLQKQEKSFSSKKEVILMRSGLLVLGGIVLLLWYKMHVAQLEHTQQTNTPAPTQPRVIAQAVPAARGTLASAEKPVTAPTESKLDMTIISPPAGLDGSDPVVRKAITDISPALLEWVLTDQQIRKWVMMVDLMADGHIPKHDRALSFPIKAFKVDVEIHTASARYFVAQENFSRTNQLIDVIAAMDPDRLVMYYEAWLPILNTAYQETGKKDQFDQRFKQAISRILNSEPVTVKPEVIKKGGIIYTYADPQLESANDVEKMMWRLGPENSGKLKVFLEKFLRALLDQNMNKS